MKTVTILLRPSLTPGTGMGAGIWASIMKIVSAMAVSRAKSTIFLVFKGTSRNILPLKERAFIFPSYQKIHPK